MKLNFPEKPYQIILVLVLGIVAFGFFLKQDWLLFTGLGIGLAAALSAWAAKWIALGWMELGKALGWVNGKILLSVVFFIFLVPIALIYKLTRKNPLNLKDQADSLFKSRDHQYVAKDLKDSW